MALQVKTKRGVRFFAVPNGERRDARTAMHLKRQGVVPGVPDLVILGRPLEPGDPQPFTRAELEEIRLLVAGEPAEGLVRRLLASVDAARGVALEMKKPDGKAGDVKPEQAEWLQFLRALGWDIIVGWGAVDALRKLRRLGFPVVVSDGPTRPNNG